ncbi:MAG TPA: peroxiredoxin [Thermoanaerobaculia bacterium]|jgi:peroxiredoxin Q/BCP
MRLRVILSAFCLAAAAAAFVSAADTTTAATPSVGAPAPSFSLTSDEGKPTKLEDFRGKWVVLYFYPKDFTSGCTLEAHNFQEDLAKYTAANAVILGVSVDTADSHKSFCAKEHLNFRLLSDPDANVSKTYGSVMDYEGKTYSARNTFLIDPQGKIAKVYTGVKPATHSAEVLEALASLSKK